MPSQVKPHPHRWGFWRLIHFAGEMEMLPQCFIIIGYTIKFNELVIRMNIEITNRLNLFVYLWSINTFRNLTLQVRNLTKLNK